MKNLYSLALGSVLLLAAGPLAAQNLLPRPDFGAATSPATAPADFITGLTLDNDNDGSSAQGSYQVTGSAGSLNAGFGGFDHTSGTASGAQLAVDGPASTATVVWQQTVAVQPGRTYSFSYWQRNLTAANAAILQLQYQGSSAALATTAVPASNSGGTVSAVPVGFQATSTTAWQQVSYTINTGTGDTQLTLTLRDQVTQSSGNDFALDDVALTQTNTGGIAGTVFEDVQYGGGAGRLLAGARAAVSSAGFAADVARPGARVELYTAAGLFSAGTYTDANGYYNFPTVVAGTTYTVRVASGTVSSLRAGYASGLLPVITCAGGATNQVGGPNPALPDAGPNTSAATLGSLTTTTQAAEALSVQTVPGSGNVTGVDFGFCFDVVVNANAGGQGSLRQFILNSNALGDESKLAQAGSYYSQVGTTLRPVSLPAATETSIFMVPDGGAHDGLPASSAGGPASQLSNGVVAIGLTAAGAGLPAVSGPATVVNGGTQTYNIGNTNGVTLGTGGPVGAAGAVLPQLGGPEVQLAGTTNTPLGLDLSGPGSGVRGLAIYGFGNGVASDANAQVRVSGSQVTVAENVVGTPATSFANPSSASAADGIRATAGSGLLVQNNLVGYLNGEGIVTRTGVLDATISLNEVRGNNLAANSILAGIAVQGSASAGNVTTISNNLVADNAGAGLDSQDPDSGGNPVGTLGSLVWAGNTASNNGRGWSTTAPRNRAGLRLFGTGHTVTQNVFGNNYGAGVLVTPNATRASISQNSIFGNGSVTAANGDAATGQIGIDLLLNAASQDQTTGTAPYVTTNGSFAGGGANSLIAYPVISSAVLTVTSGGPVLTVQGTTTGGYTVELFIAQANAVSAPGATLGNGYGQGRSFIYSGQPTTSSFTFTVPLNGLTASQRTALTTPGSLLTATATLASLGTSEFAQNVAVTSVPAVFDVSNLRLSTAAGATALNPGLTVPQAASDAMYAIESFTVNVPSGGTLTYDGTPVTGPTVVAVYKTNLLKFTPPATAGTYTFTFTAQNTNGTVSASTATYSIPVVVSNAFVANDDALDAPQGTASSLNVLLNDTNPLNTDSNNPVTFTVNTVSSPTQGTLTAGTNGTFTYTPNGGASGADSFTYQICISGGDCSNVATVSINVYKPSDVCSSANGPNLLLNPGFEAGNDGSFTSAYNFIARPAAAVTTGPNGLYPETTYAVDEDANYYHASFGGKGRGGSGKFMIVNGAANQSKVYAQVVNVVAGRYYTFSGYAQSVNGASPAILGFVINGKSVSVATTLSGTTQVYQQFSGVWFSGTSNTATFEVRDINRSAGGNDFGLDDLYFGTCSANLLAVNITHSPSIPARTAATNITPFDATLVSGSSVSVASFVVQSLPQFGTLLLGGPGGTPIVAGQVIPYSQRNALYFAPGYGQGTATFTYTANDSEGGGSSNTATYQIPVGAPLPVQLAAFTARTAGPAAQLAWTTASELNNSYFDVERSLSGQPGSFVAIGQVAGQGSKVTATSYAFLDRNAAAVGQLLYYRLHQVDTDGTSAYSPVRPVSFAGAGAALLSLYPNPTAGPGTTLDLSALPATATYQATLLDATGRCLRQWVLPGGQPQPFALAELPAGTYLLLVTGPQPDGTALRQALHVVKE